jgi:hypothetical protein
MGVTNRVGIGLSYRPARLQRLGNRLLGIDFWDLKIPPLGKSLEKVGDDWSNHLLRCKNFCPCNMECLSWGI